MFQLNLQKRHSGECVEWAWLRLSWGNLSFSPSLMSHKWPASSVLRSILACHFQRARFSFSTGRNDSSAGDAHFLRTSPSRSDPCCQQATPGDKALVLANTPASPSSFFPIPHPPSLLYLHLLHQVYSLVVFTAQVRLSHGNWQGFISSRAKITPIYTFLQRR